jgi:hypothetical protein
MLWLKTTIEGDEGVYGYYAMMWNRGHVPYFDLPSERFPLNYLLYMIPIHFFGNSIIPVRMLNNVLFLISIIALYFIAKSWFGKRASLIATLFYGLFMNAPAFQGQMAMNESLAISFVIFSIYFCHRYSENLNRILLLITGVLVAAAILIRQTEVLILILLVAMIGLARRKSSKENDQAGYARKFLADVLVLAVGVLTPMMIFVLYLWSTGALQSFIAQAVLSYLPSGYLGYFSPSYHGNFGIEFLTVVEGLPLWLFAFFGIIQCSLGFRKDGWHVVLPVFWLLPSLGVTSIMTTVAHHYSVIIAPSAILAGVALGSVIDSFKTETVERLFVRWRQNVTGVFLIVLLLLSFAPSIFLQVKQYPGTTIDWEFVKWYPGGDMGITSYDQQLQIVEYLKTNTTSSAQNLVYGWANYIPWLAGQEIPSSFLMKDIDPEGPKAGLQKVADMVDAEKFEYVVLFAPNFDDLRTKGDPVMDSTLGNYFYVESIGGAHIFSRYNAQEEYTYYSFIQHFSEALKEYDLPNGNKGNTTLDFMNDPVFVPTAHTITVNNDTKTAIFQHPLWGNGSLARGVGNSYINYQNITLPSNPKLQFGITVDPFVWDKDVDKGDGVSFEIRVQYDGKVSTVFSQYINPRQNAVQRIWNDYKIDLTEYGNKNVGIFFVTNPGPNGDAVDDWANWGNPLLLSSKPSG